DSNRGKGKPRPKRFREKPQVLGWKTSDMDEIALRQWRGRTEIAKIEALEPKFEPYSTFRVRSATGGLYEVEIRDLAGRTNSCGCIDHRVNGLGTCNHIQAVLLALRKKLGARAFATTAAKGSPRAEIFLRRDENPAPSLAGAALSTETHTFLKAFLRKNGTLVSDAETVVRLLDAASAAPPAIRI